MVQRLRAAADQSGMSSSQKAKEMERIAGIQKKVGGAPESLMRVAA